MLGDAQIPLDLSCWRPGLRLVGDQVPDFFLSLTCLRHVGDLLKTCRRPGFKQVLRKIDVMEFGHEPKRHQQAVDYMAKTGSQLIVYELVLGEKGQTR